VGGVGFGVVEGERDFGGEEVRENEVEEVKEGKEVKERRGQGAGVEIPSRFGASLRAHSTRTQDASVSSP